MIILHRGLLLATRWLNQNTAKNATQKQYCTIPFKRLKLKAKLLVIEIGPGVASEWGGELGRT